MAVQQDYSLFVQEDGTLAVAMTPPTNIGGWSLQFQVTKRFGGVSGLINKYTASGLDGQSGITVASSGQGRFQVQLNSQDTSGWDAGNYAYNVTRTDSGKKTVLVWGWFVLLSPG